MNNVNFFKKIIYKFIKIYWKVFKPQTCGVKVIIENKGKLVYIINNYGSKLKNLPGGKIEKNENPIQAGIREVKEELDIDIFDIQNIDLIFSNKEGKRDTIFIIYAKTKAETFNIDKFEILEANWFSLNDLSGFCTTAQKILKIFLKNN